MTDAVAERIATLGGVPNGLPGALVASRDWDDYELGRADTQAHLGALDLVYRGVIADHRAAIAEVDDLDPVSGDLLITQTGVLEEYHWFVRSHLEDYAGGLSNAGHQHRALRRHRGDPPQHPTRRRRRCHGQAAGHPAQAPRRLRRRAALSGTPARWTS